MLALKAMAAMLTLEAVAAMLATEAMNRACMVSAIVSSLERIASVFSADAVHTAGMSGLAMPLHVARMMLTESLMLSVRLVRRRLAAVLALPATNSFRLSLTGVNGMAAMGTVAPLLRILMAGKPTLFSVLVPAWRGDFAGDSITGERRKGDRGKKMHAYKMSAQGKDDK